MQAEGDVIRFPERASVPVDFSTFFAEEHRGLFKALYFVTGNRADAADLMHEAFLKLWERWDLDRPDPDVPRLPLQGGVERQPDADARFSARGPSSDPRSAVREHDPFNEVELREDVRRMLPLVLTPRQRAALLLLDLYDYGSEEAGGLDHGHPPIDRSSPRHARPGRTLPHHRRPAWLTLGRSSRWSSRQTEPDTDSWARTGASVSGTSPAPARSVHSRLVAAIVAALAIVALTGPGEDAATTGAEPIRRRRRRFRRRSERRSSDSTGRSASGSSGMPAGASGLKVSPDGRHDRVHDHRWPSRDDPA